MFGEFVLKLLLQISPLGAQLRQAGDCVHHQVKAIQIVKHGHVEGSGDRAFLFVAANMQVLMVGTAVGKSMDQPWVSMERKDDRLVRGEDRIEICIA
jgi:hypothetical protein